MSLASVLAAGGRSPRRDPGGDESENQVPGPAWEIDDDHTQKQGKMTGQVGYCPKYLQNIVCYVGDRTEKVSGKL